MNEQKLYIVSTVHIDFLFTDCFSDYSFVVMAGLKIVLNARDKHGRIACRSVDVQPRGRG